MSNVSIPICLSGSITALEEVSICMDGASHQLHTITPDPIRLKATNDETKQALDKYTDSKLTISVCGYWVEGVEGKKCCHLAVYLVSETKVSTNQFQVISLTSSLPSYQDCSVVSEGAFIIAIYSSVYGPASETDCRTWIINNCVKEYQSVGPSDGGG